MFEKVLQQNIQALFLMLQLFVYFQKEVDGQGHIFCCYMTGENPVSWLAQYDFINHRAYLKTGLQVDIGWK